MAHPRFEPAERPDPAECSEPAERPDTAELLSLVDEVMTPRRRFYDYEQANDYADDCRDTVELLARHARRAAPELIRDAFDPDIADYADALTSKSLQRYRDAVAALELGPYRRYPLERLAVLDRDRDALVAAHRGEPANAFAAECIARDLDEAGLHDDALEYAGIAIALDTRGWDQRMVTHVVDDAFARGDLEGAVTARGADTSLGSHRSL